jgi:hypothetical protein
LREVFGLHVQMAKSFSRHSAHSLKPCHHRQANEREIVAVGQKRAS